MSKHTPGPWEFRKRPREPWMIYANGGSIMGNECYYPWVPDEEADWRLIAAAPELLEALQELMVAADRVSAEPVTWLGKARAAIAKATGEPA